MDDLVKRLRERVVYDSRHYVPDPLLKEAADRIEALEAENERLRGVVIEYKKGFGPGDGDHAVLGGTDQ